MAKKNAFEKKVLAYYKKHGRSFPWRGEQLPAYYIVVSELMLQQTQADRVVPKFQAFITQFPHWKALAAADTEAVLRAWQGLGYNRRALYLKRIAEKVVHEYNGRLPKNPEILEQFPGIGHYTARAIAAFAYNEGYPFLETNIRTALIDHYFPNEPHVSDIALFSVLTIPVAPRIWYAALMDYGAHLKRAGIVSHRQAKEYKKQSPFKGSRRALRGQILRHVLMYGADSIDSIFPNAGEVILSLRKEGLIV